MNTDNYIELIVRLIHGTITMEEKQLLTNWLNKRDEFDQLAEEQWQLASHKINEQYQSEQLDLIEQKLGFDTNKKPSTKQRHLHPVWIRFGAVAASVLFLLSIGLNYYLLTPEQTIPDSIVSVDKGQKASLTLPDGTKVWLNSGSQITYGTRFNNKERILQLDGEAFFDVAPDKDRPFIVEAGPVSVKALGTSFNVKSYGDEEDIQTVLTSGKVEVFTDNTSYTIEPDQRVVYNKATGDMEKTGVTNGLMYAEWRNNRLIFRSETLENIVRQLERTYNTEIIIESESLKQYKITGSAGNNSLESILQIMALTCPLTYEVKNDKIILKENIKEKEYYNKALVIQ